MSAFTWSHDGRRFRDGAMLDPAYYVSTPVLGGYFVDRYAFYHHYCPTFSVGVSFYSPFAFYFGVCAPFVYSQFCFVAAPPVEYCDVPVYTNDVCEGWRGYASGYYLASGYYEVQPYELPAGVRLCVDRIEHSYRVGAIADLGYCVNPGVHIAIYQRGHYGYSLGCNDYLDMTRDALRSMHTVSFALDRIHRLRSGVYVCSGTHTYLNRFGAERAVYISFAIEQYAGTWDICQIDTAPDRL